MSRAQPWSQQTTPSAETRPQSQQTTPSAETRPQSQQTTPSAETQPQSQQTTPSAETRPQSQQTTPSAETRSQSQQTTSSAETQPQSQQTTPSAETRPESQQTTSSAEIRPQSQQTTPSAETRPLHYNGRYRGAAAVVRAALQAPGRRLAVLFLLRQADRASRPTLARAERAGPGRAGPSCGPCGATRRHTSCLTRPARPGSECRVNTGPVFQRRPLGRAIGYKLMAPNPTLLAAAGGRGSAADGRSEWETSDPTDRPTDRPTAELTSHGS